VSGEVRPCAARGRGPPSLNHHRRQSQTFVGRQRKKDLPFGHRKVARDRVNPFYFPIADLQVLGCSVDDFGPALESRSFERTFVSTASPEEMERCIADVAKTALAHSIERP
jgi:hypothetical protein